MLKVQIAVHGCDDSTYIIIEVTAEEALFVEKIAKLITEASTYRCQPRMQVEKL